MRGLARLFKPRPFGRASVKNIPLDGGLYWLPCRQAGSREPRLSARVELLQTSEVSQANNIWVVKWLSGAELGLENEYLREIELLKLIAKGERNEKA